MNRGASQIDSVSRRWVKTTLRVLMIIFVVYVLPVGAQFALYYTDKNRTGSWWDLRSDSSQQAPDPAMTGDAIIQVYAARAVRWRGVLGVHTWVATKRSEEDIYTRLEVMGYALRWKGESVQIRPGQPDRYWYGSKPDLLREVRGGDEVDALIDRLHNAASNYQYNHRYNIWPGPNSNTFTAHLGRRVKELNLELPTTAIGKDYLPDGNVFSRTPSGSGLQLSLGGVFGLILGLEEGIELNLAGLTAGIDLSPLAIKLPGVGRMGFSDFERNVLR